MNIKKVLNLIGFLMMLEAIFMMLPLIVSFIYKESVGIHFLICILILLMIGLVLQRIFVSDNRFYSAEGFVTVSLGWIILSIFGAIPFYFSKEIPNYLDAIFETVSGFTTTGATILNDASKLSKSMNFWRCFTHFVGGMGVLVLMLAIIPTKSENMQIMKAESPGPQVGKLVSKVSDTARMLYLIYVALTLIAIVSYKISGMPLYDSICIGFGTAGTGGFVVTSNGCAAYSPLSQNLIATFMLLFGINFNVFFLIIIKKFKDAFFSEELRVYFIIVIVSVLIIFINILSMYSSWKNALHTSYFHVASIITTTGFACDDFAKWPELSQALLLFLMICGGCAGSTAGGIKVSRIIISYKIATNEIYSQLHPSSVKIIKFEDKPVQFETVRTVLTYVVIYCLFCLVGIILISIENFDFATTVSSVLETFNNIGQGLSKVGPTGNFSIFSPFSKIIFIILMLTGRLEIFPIIILFSKKTWKRSS